MAAGYVPIKEHLTVYEGDDYTLELKAGISNIAGYTIKLQVRDNTCSRYPIISLDGTIVDATSGRYSIHFSSGVTLGKARTNAYQYDIKFTKTADGTITTDRFGDFNLEARTTDILDNLPFSTTGDMSKSIYDKNGNGIVDSAETIAGSDTASPHQYYGKDADGNLGWHIPTSQGTGNIDVSTLSPNAIIKWDSTQSKFVDSGVKSLEDGKLTIDPNTLDFGLTSMSSVIDQVAFTNRATGKSYMPVDQELKPNMHTARLRDIGAIETVIRSDGGTQDVTNPVNDITIDANELFIGGKFTLSKPATNVVLEIFDKRLDLMVWQYKFGDLSGGEHEIIFDVPYIVEANYEYLIKLRSLDGDLVAEGNGTNFNWTIKRAKFTYEDIALKKDVSNLDSNGDGSVDLADAIKDAATSGTNKYYGTNSMGTAGFYPVPNQSDPDGYDDLKQQVEANKVAVNNHGNQLTQHASEISTNTKNVQVALDTARAADAHLTTFRKSAVEGIVANTDHAHKTITLTLTSQSGNVDHAMVDISSWFTGGDQPQPVDFDIWYGWTVNPPMDEATIQRLGSKKSIRTLNGTEVILTRRDNTPSYMWVWIPTHVGTVTGSTIADSSDIKTALQALETKAEANAVIYSDSKAVLASQACSTGAWTTVTHNLNDAELSSVTFFDEGNNLQNVNASVIWKPKTGDANSIEVYQASGALKTLKVVCRI